MVHGLKTLASRLVWGSLLLSLPFGATAKAADSEADFYKGKQVNVIVPTTPGARYDLFARLVATYMPRHIPGTPTFVVQNMGGAGGLVAANYMANVAPRDGTVIGNAISSTPTAPLLSPGGAQFDVNKFSWLGSISKETLVGYVWHTSKIMTLDDLKTKEAAFGGNAIGAASIDYAVYARDFMGLKLKVIPGYPNPVDTKLAMERGELDGTFANSWGDLNSSEPNWVPEGKVRVFTQFGLQKNPELPNVPMFYDLVKSESDRQALELLLARQEFSMPFYMPPEVPAARLQVMRAAFDATINDPEFLGAAKKAKLNVVNPMNGVELQALVKKVSSTPDAVVKNVLKTFNDFNNTNKK